MQVTDTWDSTPGNRAGLTEWATQAAGRRAEHDPRDRRGPHLMDAQAAAPGGVGEVPRPGTPALLAEELGDSTPRPGTRALPSPQSKKLQTASAPRQPQPVVPKNSARSHPEKPPALIETKRAAAERACELAAERARRLRGTPDHTHAEPNRHGPSLGL